MDLNEGGMEEDEEEGTGSEEQDEDEWGGFGGAGADTSTSGPSGGGGKPKKPPTGEEVRAIKEAKDLYKSNTFKLRVRFLSLFTLKFSTLLLLSLVQGALLPMLLCMKPNLGVA